MLQIDLPIGTEFYYSGHKLKCCLATDDDTDGCGFCFFEYMRSAEGCPGQGDNGFLACGFESRKDFNDVYFKEINDKRSNQEKN